MSVRKLILPLVAVVAVVAGLMAGHFMQGERPVKGYPGLGGDFQLESVDGPVSLADLSDHVVVLYFGFVNCPDACPMTMGKVSAALQTMEPEQRERVRVVLISVDPERDTLEMLANYMSFFGEEFIGLGGSPEVIDQVARNYRVLYQRVEMPNSGLGYTVDHTSNTFIIAPGGVVRFIVSHGSGYEEYRDRIIDTINDV
jgi:protein SCO1